MKVRDRILANLPVAGGGEGVRWRADLERDNFGRVSVNLVSIAVNHSAEEEVGTHSHVIPSQPTAKKLLKTKRKTACATPAWALMLFGSLVT